MAVKRREETNMTYLGHVENGVIVLDEANDLPDGTEVRVEEVKRPTHAELFKDFIGCLSDLPEDMADNHDHYIHGTRKR